MADEAIETDAPTNKGTAPPATHPESGIAMHGNYPLNSLLRAEALHADGKTTDPDELVTDEHIAQAGQRRAVLDRAAERAADESAPSMKWDRPRLVAHASQIGAVHEGDAHKQTILDAIEARQAQIDADHEQEA